MRSLTLLALASFVTGGCFSAKAADTPKHPNVVFILVDDLGWGELGCYGQQKIKTPNIDKLAREGIRFTDSYSGAPVCAPARASLMTGLHLGHSPIRGNKEAKPEGQYPIPPEYTLFPQLFQKAGYATAAVGKWGLGPVGSEGDPLKRGFDHFYGYNCQRVAHSYYPPHLWNDDQKVIINKKPIPGHGKVPADQPVDMAKWTGEQHSSPLIVEDALKFIDTQAKAKKPFFLYFALIEPPVSLMPEKQFLDQYPESWDKTSYRGENGYTPQTRPRAAYAAMITGIDDHVGKIMTKLDKLGLTDDTLIIFTSDNGTTHRGVDNRWNVGGVDAEFFNSTAGLRGFKGAVYEGGIRIPCVMRWPENIPANLTTNFPTYFPDYAPTLCAAAGIENPIKGDGINILPVMLNKGQKPERNPMVWVFPEYGGQVAVRIGDFKVLRRNLNKKNPDSWEVYNVVKDIGEKENLASKRADLIKKAVEILENGNKTNNVFPLAIPGIK
ncbi:MAG: arylsulfatase [Puniceicoccales bacterium]|jgi:arylsulfatase A-like enzyme|nr:arylsulfatase [Puniceicoccales bacterium]